jgi:multicomponent Na+:H+ antiporter subunit D
MVRTAPLLAAMFFVSAISLAGVPPFSGFVSKLALVDAGFAVQDYAVVGVSLAVSLLTIFAMSRIWMGAFWSPPEVEAPQPRLPVRRGGGPLLMVAPTVALVVASLAIAAAAGPIFAFSERTAQDLMDRQGYIEQVLG